MLYLWYSVLGARAGCERGCRMCIRGCKSICITGNFEGALVGGCFQVGGVDWLFEERLGLHAGGTLVVLGCVDG